MNTSKIDDSFKNPHNYIPAKFTPHTIGIIGGAGAMGKLLTRLYTEQGYKVLTTGKEKTDDPRILKRLNRKVVSESDVIILAMPINEIERGWEAVIGCTKSKGLRQKLLIDIASTKVNPLAALGNMKGATIIGTHPMFGPLTPDLKGQNVVICPLTESNSNYVLQQRAIKCLEWLKASWELAGANVEIMPASLHDQLASVVQVGTLLNFTGFAHLVTSLEKSALVQKLSTPNSRAITDRLKVVLRVDENHLNVYAQILASNAYATQVIDQLINFLCEMKAKVQNIDHMTEFLMQLAQNYQRKAIA